MEQMLGDVMRPPICLRSLLLDFQTALQDTALPKSPTDIPSAMRLQNKSDSFSTVEANCALDQLDQLDDVRVMTYTPGYTETIRRTVSVIPVEALNLQTFSALVEEKERNLKNPFERTRYSFKCVKLPERKEKNADYYRDLLIYVRVYRPARATHQGQRLEKPVFAEEFQCLGSNFLTELRDKISCVCNKKRFFDISENPTDELVGKETDPGYFFITDTFYNDKRNPANADYSETVRSWAKGAQGLKDLQFKVANMEETRFLDLSVSLGFPQLYHHHGNCEHVFVFSQIEFITPSTKICDTSAYPLLTSLSAFNMRSCNMCAQSSYVFIVEHSTRQLHDPAYLCAKCFYGYHYIDGKKIGEFRAYKVNEYEGEEIVDEEYIGVNDELNDAHDEEEEDQVEQTTTSTKTDDDLHVSMERSRHQPSECDSDTQESMIIIKTEQEDISKEVS